MYCQWHCTTCLEGLMVSLSSMAWSKHENGHALMFCPAAEFGILQAGCFAYLGLGGSYVAGPVGLLSAITPKPLLLFYHFFAVAIYSIWLLFTRGPPIPGVEEERRKKPGVLDYPGLVVLSFKTVSAQFYPLDLFRLMF